MYFDQYTARIRATEGAERVAELYSALGDECYRLDEDLNCHDFNIPVARYINDLRGYYLSARRAVHGTWPPLTITMGYAQEKRDGAACT